MSAPRTPVRVVVADDSRLMRRLLSDGLAVEGVQVVGLASDGEEAVELCRALRPDVLTLDLAMPGLDGLGVLRALRGPGPRPAVVVCSAFSPSLGLRALDALAEGACDLVAKPASGEGLEAFLGELRAKVVAAASARARAPKPAPPPPAPSPPPAAVRERRRAVVIAASTGGPRALMRLLPSLPSPLGRGLLVVQHMPAGFTSSLAARLDAASALAVREATDGETPAPQAALVAPGGRHLRLSGNGRLRLCDEPAVEGLRPRADLLIADAVRLYGEALLLVVLTGMGKDGLEGARAVKAQGGRVLVEAESSCTIYGMPRAVAEAGLADAVLDLSELPAAICAEAGA
jgi:two-component system chemotaxis response regulator CheB